MARHGTGSRYASTALTAAVFALIFASAAHIASRPASACGFHMFTFGGAGVWDSWAKLRARLLKGGNIDMNELMNAYWGVGMMQVPGAAEKPPDKVQPNPRFRNGGATLSTLINDLILILEYVDPYNYAPDSPPWMATQEGREQAIEEAPLALREIGRAAAPYLVEALRHEYALRDDPRYERYREFRRMQRRLQVLRQQLDAVNEADEKYRMLRQKQDELRARLQEVGKKEMAPLQERMAAVSKKLSDPKVQGKERADAAQEWRGIQEEQQKAAARLAELCKDDHAKLGQVMQELNQRTAELMQSERTRAAMAEMMSAQNALARLGSFGAAGARKGDPYACDPTMCPAEDFAERLSEALAGLGAEALPALDRIRGDNTPIGREAARIRSRLKTPKGLIEVAAALKDDDGAVRTAAVALAKEVGWDAVPPLIEGLKSEDGKAREDCLAALRWLTHADIGSDPQAWQRWHSDRLRAEIVVKKDADRPADAGRQKPDVAAADRRDGPGSPQKKRAPAEDERDSGKEPPNDDKAAKPPGKERIRRVDDDDGEPPHPVPTGRRLTGPPEGARTAPPGAIEVEPEGMPELEIRKKD